MQTIMNATRDRTISYCDFVDDVSTYVDCVTFMVKLWKPMKYSQTIFFRFAVTYYCGEPQYTCSTASCGPIYPKTIESGGLHALLGQP